MSLLRTGENVHIIGLDNMKDYCDVSIKENRLSQIEKLVESANGYGSFIRGNLLDFVTILQEELIRAKVLPEAYDFEAHKKLGPCSRVMFR